MGEPPLKRAKLENGDRKKPRRIKKRPIKPPKPGSPDATILFALVELLGQATVDSLTEAGTDREAPFERFTDVEVEVKALSSHGDGLALADDQPNWVVVVPFCLPGERVLARVHRHDRLHSHADLVRVVRPTGKHAELDRDDSRIGCRYFGMCSGCQYQELSYAKQLEIKQSVVRKAFAHASTLAPEQIPDVLPTLPSPLQYGYRTKLTPHFEPPKKKEGMDGQPALSIGFEERGRKRVLDIEQCPIATKQVNDRLVTERERVKITIDTFKRGATLLLRHALPALKETESSDDIPYCETNHRATVRERVGELVFEFTAGSFFQNNNSILPDLVAYVADQLTHTPSATPARFLVDAYCGSGLFSLSLASRFERVKGVEISSESVRFAKHNAKLNGIENCDFLEGKAEAIFEAIDLPSDETTVIIDPPRKGCDELFLSQLIAFSPSTIVYVSCSVHTQAPDVGYLVKKGGYELVSLRGVDLFPQTHHVESVALLRKVGTAVA